MLRELVSADFASWHRLWRDYLRFYNTALADETTQTTWQRLLASAEPMFALGFWGPVDTHSNARAPRDELLGFAHAVYHRSCWSEGDYCYLQDLFVAENARRRGVARALIDAVYTRAKAAQCSRVYWLTHETNAAARALYDNVAVRSGFIQYRKVFSL